MGFSALAGGIATGFIQAQQERAAAEADTAKLAPQRKEARLGRESRESIAALGRQTQLDIAEKNLAATQKNAKKNQSIKVGNATFALMNQYAQYNNKLPVNTFSKEQQEALESTYGIKPVGGEYNLLPLRQAIEAKEDNALQKKIATNIVNGTTNPSPYASNKKILAQVRKLMSPQGDSKVNKTKDNKTTVNYLKSLQKKWDTSEKIRLKINAKKVYPDNEIIPYTDKDKNVKFTPIPNKTDVLISSNIFAHLTDTQRAKVLSSSPNNNLWNYTMLQNFDSLIQSKQGAEKDAIIKHVSKNKGYKTAFLNVKAALESTGIEYTSSNGEIERSITNTTTKKSMPNIHNLFTENKKSNVLIPERKTSSSLRTIEEQANMVVENSKGKINYEDALAQIKSGEVAVIHTGGTNLGMPTSPIKNSHRDDEGTVIIERRINTPIKRTTKKQTPNDLNVTNVTSEPIITVDYLGNEEVQKFGSPLDMTDGRVSKLMYYDDLLRADPKYFESPDKATELDEFLRLSSVYTSLNEFIDNPTDSNLEVVKEQLQKTFEFKTSEGKINQEALEKSVEILSQKQAFSEIVPPPTVSLMAGGERAITTSRPMHYTEAEIYKDPPLNTKIKDLKETINKLGETKENIRSFKNNQLKLSATDTLLKSLSGDGNITSSDATNLFNLLKEDPNFIKNKELMEALKVQEKRVGRKGFKIGTEAASSTVVFLQKIRDYVNAAPLIIAQVTPDFLKEKFKFSADSYKSSNPENDGFVKSRLAHVEQWAKAKSKEWKSTISVASEAAKEALDKASNAGNPEDRERHMKVALRQQVIAYQAYLLAQNAMTKVSMTYTYAGMVQGQNGGRAISNEDFAILYRAIWGGAGSETGEGSFDRVEDIVNFLGVRAENDAKYARIKNGSLIERKMLEVSRSVGRAKFRRLYNESKNFNLLRHEAGLPQQQTNEASNVFPQSIITQLDGRDIKLDSANLARESNIFANTFSQVSKNLPPRKRLEKTQYGTTVIGGNIASYNNLSKEEKQKVLGRGVSMLRRFGNTPKIVSRLNRYGQNGLKLGDVLSRASRRYGLQEAIRNTKDSAEKAQAQESLKKLNIGAAPEKRLILNLIIHLYNTKR